MNTGSKLRRINQRPTRPNAKNNQINVSSEQLAKWNLIQISNLQYTETADQVPEKPSTMPSRGEAKSVIRMRKVPKNAPILEHKSVNLKRVSVTERWTESFKSGRRANSTDIQTKKPERENHLKVALNMSHYLLLVNKKPSNLLSSQKLPAESIPNSNQITPSYRPKPSISSRTFFYSRRTPQSIRGEKTKINPQEETYWRIFKG